MVYRARLVDQRCPAGTTRRQSALADRALQPTRTERITERTTMQPVVLVYTLLLTRRRRRRRPRCHRGAGTKAGIAEGDDGQDSETGIVLLVRADHVGPDARNRFCVIKCIYIYCVFHGTRRRQSVAATRSGRWFSNCGTCKPIRPLVYRAIVGMYYCAVILERGSFRKRTENIPFLESYVDCLYFSMLGYCLVEREIARTTFGNSRFSCTM